MTYYTLKSYRQWKRYKSNIEVCAKNDTILLFCLYIFCLTYPTIVKSVLLETRLNTISMEKSIIQKEGRT